MVTTNYFKAKGRFFFFSDKSTKSIADAFDAARLVDPTPSVFQPVGIPGPWDALPIICPNAEGDHAAEVE